MLKKIYSSLFFIFLFQRILCGQEMLMIEYEQFIMNDTITNYMLESQGTLYIDSRKKASVYHWDRNNKNYKTKVQKNEDGSIRIYSENGWAGLDSIGRVVYKDYYNNSMRVRDLIDIWYIVEDSVTFNWTINDESKSLNNMTLQKAECDFRGRHYIAWFNPNLPISDGPWKFKGLPGLIIEVYDEKKHVSFNFKRLNILSDISDFVKIPTAGTLIGITTFRDKENQFFKDIHKKIEADIKQQGLTVYNLTVRTNTIERE